MKRVLIKSVKARACYNSRGDQTLEVEVYVDNTVGRIGAPSGASVGKFEVVAFPPGGVEASINLIKSLSRKLVGLDASDIRVVGQALREFDGTERYSCIGGSTAFAITVATAEAASRALSLPLYRLLNPGGEWRIPYPLGNVLGGGKHAGPGAPDIQEFLVCPVGAGSIDEALAANAAVHKEVGKEIMEVDPSFTGGKSDEGGWSPRVGDEQAFEIVSRAVAIVSDRVGFKVRMGVDFASSSLWDEERGEYVYARQGIVRSSEDQVNYVEELVESYDLVYVEDPLHEEAFEEHADLTRRLKGVYVAADDLLVTNVSRLLKAAELGACNSAILKVNQAGGLSEALDFAEAARRHNYSLITSHRSGDTPDPHIAHIAVATSSKMLKSGVVGGERVAKLNELIRLGEQLGKDRMARLESLDL